VGVHLVEHRSLAACHSVLVLVQDNVSPANTFGKDLGGGRFPYWVALIEQKCTGANYDKLKFVFEWSPEWIPSPDIAQIESYSIRPAMLPIIRDAAEKMRRSYISKVRTITGQVTSPKSEHNPADLLDFSSPREIVIEGNSDELTSIKVRVVLSPTDYILAVEAHKSGSLISITGLLERRKRGWSLSDPSVLSVRPST